MTPAEEKIIKTVSAMKLINTKGELGRFIASEILKYSMYDLQIIGARARDEVDILPPAYREKFRPFAKEWFFGRYHRLLSMYRSGEFDKMDSPIKDRETFTAFCDMIPKGCSYDEKEGHRLVPVDKAPLYDLFYYLLSTFAMFVLDEPGHPVGTPFPGGFEVYKKREDYFCPIRDKEEEIFHSICNFCPAKQDKNNI
ncbi:DUF2115 domain-containing protein [Methanoplanus sp. FWC-SCC4]|uniref:UPF0305 protein F1737_10895 n=1 Tax=Methanochimaera problematica TaxID=2609417 RepID=A0AA97FFC3_9EURY|nr:DUF2115 domain-containing protein [Methanoplanus sp. FWC-SCC4]WOF17149.1 DUF2115 domain-containing protein [Methanoplanus sp. FWC-SCC4]